MRNLLIASGILAALAGCSKNGTVAPNTTTTATKIDSATNLHTVMVTAPVQNTQTILKDSTLTLIFKEDVSLLLTPKSYDQSYSIHLTEDFSASALAKLNYSTTNGKGQTYYDYTDDNLNNIGQKTITDTTVNGVALKKIHVVRNFNFVKTYPDVKTASAATNTLSNTYTDKVTFSSYVLFDKVYPATSTTAVISYVH